MLTDNLRGYVLRNAGSYFKIAFTDDPFMLCPFLRFAQAIPPVLCRVHQLI